jgi:hypothetical protein
MALVGLKRASELTGKNQSTIHRAMKAGRLSYSLSDSGERLLDTSELTRRHCQVAGLAWQSGTG